MKKKGFTLIELLAVIVVLAVIALIATPIVLNLIKTAKIGSAEQSVTGYVKAIENTIIKDMLDDKNISDGTYKYDSLEVDVSGKTPTNGYYILEKNTIKNAIFCVDGYTIEYKNSVSKKISDTCEVDENLINANILLNDIENKLNSSTQEGVYYFDEYGNLDYNLNNIKIELDENTSNVKGNVSVYNSKVIYACFNYNDKNYEYDYKGKKLELINHKCSTVRGENLVVNGDLSYGDNTNFPALTYKDSAFSISGNKNVVSDFYIPIDPNKTYELGIDMKSSNTTATYYVGFRDFDVDKKEITPDSVMYIPQAITTLSRDLNNGDTVVYLTDLSKWKNSTSSSSYKRGFIFWNYKDSTGYEYPELIYSKNIFNTLWNDSNVNKTNNTITLNSAWSKGTIKAGTKLSQTTSGNVFNYSILQNKTVTTSWVTYKASNINGIGKKNIDSNGNGDTVSTTFRDGSKFIKISFFIDYNKTADTTTNIKNIYFREVIS